ncbi:Rho GTPase-activating protein 17, partial [Larimichthys crocea]
SVPRLYTGNGQKKLPLTSLSQAMVEGGNQLGEDSLIGKMMEVCGDAENRLASELMLHELQIEKDVLDPLSQLAEATKSIISGTNTQALTAKADLLKEEMDESMNKVELCKTLEKFEEYTQRYLVKFLSKLAQDSEVNKMTPSNIAIVLGPNLMWAKTEGSLAEMAAATSVHVVAIVEPIIQHADWFFPEDVEFNVSGMFAMPTPASNHNNHLDYDCATIERKRPVSMVGPDNDMTRKDNTPNKHSDHTLRRGSNTLGRKQHTSPAFQPPLPPVEAPGQGHGPGQVPQPSAEPQPQPQPQAPSGGSGTDTSQHSLAQNLAALAAAQQLLAQHTEELSNPKLRDSTPAQTPLLQRNGSAGGGQAAGQLGTGTPGAGSMGPSPHMMRRVGLPPPAATRPQTPEQTRASRHHPSPPTPASDTNGICATAYKMMDPAMSFKGLSRALVPELAVDQQPATASSSSSSSSFLPPPRDCDLDTESTVL